MHICSTSMTNMGINPSSQFSTLESCEHTPACFLSHVDNQCFGKFSSKLGSTLRAVIPMVLGSCPRWILFLTSKSLAEVEPACKFKMCCTTCESWISRSNG